MSVWFSADLHLGHDNIRKYCNRPFSSVEEMDRTLIANWNSKIPPDGLVYLLGDFCFTKGARMQQDALAYRRRLNGKIHFIKGNHDKPAFSIKESWESFSNYLEINVEGQAITLLHYAMRTWNGSHRGAWSLFGHSHSNLPDDPHALSIDVGTDCHNYFPISFEEIKRIMKKKLWVPIDHHGDRQEGGGNGLSREEYAKEERHRQYKMLKKEFE